MSLLSLGKVFFLGRVERIGVFLTWYTFWFPMNWVWWVLVPFSMFNCFHNTLLEPLNVSLMFIYETLFVLGGTSLWIDHHLRFQVRRFASTIVIRDPIRSGPPFGDDDIAMGCSIDISTITAERLLFLWSFAQQAIRMPCGSPDSFFRWESCWVYPVSCPWFILWLRFLPMPRNLHPRTIMPPYCSCSCLLPDCNSIAPDGLLGALCAYDISVKIHLI